MYVARNFLIFFFTVNIVELFEKTEVDPSKLLIKDLVQSSIVRGDVIPEVIFFGLSPGSKSMVSTLSRLRDSTLLRQFWEQNGRKALTIIAPRGGQKTSLTVADVLELVWKPSEEQRLSLKERFQSGEIPFKEVDKLLELFDNKYEDLAGEIRIISSNNRRQDHRLENIIRKRMEKIKKYHKLHTCIKAAGVMLKFKNAFGLQGDFQDVEVLYNQVYLNLQLLLVM